MDEKHRSANGTSARGSRAVTCPQLGTAGLLALQCLKPLCVNNQTTTQIQYGVYLLIAKQVFHRLFQGVVVGVPLPGGRLSVAARLDGYIIHVDTEVHDGET